MAAGDFIHRREVGKARCAQVHPERLVGAVGQQVAAELAFGCFHGSVGFAFGHAIALGEEFEVMDQRFHVVLHLFAGGRNHLEILQHYVAGVFLQPLHALQDDLGRLTHFLDTHQVAVVAVARHTHRDIEIHLVVHGVGLLLAQVPFHA